MTAGIQLILRRTASCISMTEKIAKVQSPAGEPKGSMSVSCACKKVGDVKLGSGWTWKTPDAKLIDGAAYSACCTADDADNYETVSVMVKLNAPHSKEGTITREDIVEATCAKAGSYTEVFRCAECGEEVRVKKLTPTLAHSFKNGSCEKCGAPDPTYVAENSGFDATDTQRNAAQASIALSADELSDVLGEQDKAAEHLKLVSQEITLDEAEEQTYENLANDKFNSEFKTAMALEIDLKKTAESSAGDVTETKKPVTVTIKLAQSAVKPGQSSKARTYKVVRKHKSIIDILEAILKGDMLSFSTDKFSEFVVIWSDTDLGDINGDGEISAKDVLALRKFLVDDKIVLGEE